ncbi:hypothetical protein BSPWISOXPB_1336 [uncultured Gammaproteobacteria bacterium]|nr:hypothetical protein BSPWISOXPB_1336 [uncultured Gammaproteobacteria bacterium]
MFTSVSLMSLLRSLVLDLDLDLELDLELDLDWNWNCFGRCRLFGYATARVARTLVLELCLLLV